MEVKIWRTIMEDNYGSQNVKGKLWQVKLWKKNYGS